MDLHDCTVRLAGSLMMAIPKEGITAPELVVLRHLHGEDAVIDIVQTRQTKRKHSVEFERLVAQYGMKPVATCFPGAQSMMRLPATLAEAGLLSKQEAEAPDDEEDEGDVDASAQAPADVVAKLTAKAKALA